MSEPRWLKAQRGEPRVVPKPTKRGLPCPACKGKTVQRDVSLEDSWYVEYCVDGQVRVSTKVDGREIFRTVPCEYWGSGFERKN